MILKQYEPTAHSDPRLAAGVKAEKQAAHYLDRYFGPRDEFYLLHDLRLEHDGDVAQIDHLVLHPYGAAIVESKSVSTAVRINARGEWERRKPSGWAGMPNPLLQAERQALLLKRLLASRTEELLDKALMGALQGTFRFMALDVFAAISDGGTIRRANAKQAPTVLKADAVPPAILRTVEGYRRDNSLFSFNLNFKQVWDAPHYYNPAEVRRVGRFLAAQHKPRFYPASQPRAAGHTSLVPCKYCGSLDVGQPRNGRYGPYVVCNECGKNTSLTRR